MDLARQPEVYNWELGFAIVFYNSVLQLCTRVTRFRPDFPPNSKKEFDIIKP
jgi:hypothetical protein